MPIEIFFYYRDPCDLCEKMRGDLAEFLNGSGAAYDLEVTMRDIDEDPGWLQRFNEYVPVLVVNNEEVCHYFLDSDALLESLSKK